MNEKQETKLRNYIAKWELGPRQTASVTCLVQQCIRLAASQPESQPGEGDPKAFEIFAWLEGYSDSMERPDGAGAYWWRKELRQRILSAYGDEYARWMRPQYGSIAPDTTTPPPQVSGEATSDGIDYSDISRDSAVMAGLKAKSNTRSAPPQASTTPAVTDEDVDRIALSVKFYPVDGIWGHACKVARAVRDECVREVKMPDKHPGVVGSVHADIATHCYSQGWNACLAAVRKLNKETP